MVTTSSFYCWHFDSLSMSKDDIEALRYVYKQHIDVVDYLIFRESEAMIAECVNIPEVEGYISFSDKFSADQVSLILPKCVVTPLSRRFNDKRAVFKLNDNVEEFGEYRNHSTRRLFPDQSLDSVKKPRLQRKPSVDLNLPDPIDLIQLSPLPLPVESDVPVPDLPDLPVPPSTPISSNVCSSCVTLDTSDAFIVYNNNDKYKLE